MSRKRKPGQTPGEPGKPGRPSELVKRDERIVFRTTSVEKQVIEIMADEAGLSVSDYVRKCAMNKSVKLRFTPEELEHFKTLHAFHRNFTLIGNLIRRDNARITQELLAEIAKTQQEIKKHLKRFED